MSSPRSEGDAPAGSGTTEIVSSWVTAAELEVKSKNLSRLGAELVKQQTTSQSGKVVETPQADTPSLDA